MTGDGSALFLGDDFGVRSFITSSEEPQPDLITVCFIAPVDARINDFIALSRLLRRLPEFLINPLSFLSLPKKTKTV
jgi:hypothetical protein